MLTCWVRVQFAVAELMQRVMQREREFEEEERKARERREAEIQARRAAEELAMRSDSDSEDDAPKAPVLAQLALQLAPQVTT